MFKILTVEDNDTFRKSLKEILLAKFPSLDIFEAGNGKEALEKVETLCPDIIFMDIKLPDENGLELTKKIKAHYPNIIIIILTIYDLPEYRETAYRYGANHFLSKTSPTKEILSLLESILSGMDPNF